MIKVELRRLNDAVHFEAANEDGVRVQIDGSPDVGQMLLAAMGGCSAIDLVNILKKQKQDLLDVKITVTGEREKGAVPSLYTDVHAHYKLFGNIDKDKAAKAVALAVEKYCSVAKTLEKTAKVTYSFEIIANKES
jgi:putative redox protein